MSPAAHIAGVGDSSTVSNDDLEDLAIAAVTKALLDAGVTYGDVDQSIACFLDVRERIPRTAFNVFGMEGVPVCNVENAAGLSSAVQAVRSGPSQCTLVVGLDSRISPTDKRPQSVAVALVIVSTVFLTSHAYLKDSSIQVRACVQTGTFYSRSANETNDARQARTGLQLALSQAQMSRRDVSIVEVKQSPSQQHLREALEGLETTQPREPWSSPPTSTSETGWLGLCRLVYQLRGWATDAPASRARNCLQYTTSEDGTARVLILARSDGQPAPAWQEIKNVRDGRERLGYNPAVAVKAITQEDVEAIRAKREFTKDADLLRLKLPVKGGDRAALARL